MSSPMVVSDFSAGRDTSKLPPSRCSMAALAMPTMFVKRGFLLHFHMRFHKPVKAFHGRTCKGTSKLNRGHRHSSKFAEKLSNGCGNTGRIIDSQLIHVACNRMISQRNNANLNTMTNKSNNEMRIWQHMIATTATP